MGKSEDLSYDAETSELSFGDKKEWEIARRAQFGNMRLKAEHPYHSAVAYSSVLTKSSSQKISQRYEDRLHRHPNETAIELLNNIKEIRRLKRKKPWELVTNADSDF